MNPTNTFQAWMDKVDAVLIGICGMPSDCLPDWDYWDAWDAGVSPRAAAGRAMRNASFC